MALLLEILLVAVVTIALFFGASQLVRVLLRFEGVKGHLAAMVLRFAVTVALALGVGLLAGSHRFALVFTVGAAYFAAAVLDGIRHFRTNVVRTNLGPATPRGTPTR